MLSPDFYTVLSTSNLGSAETTATITAFTTSCMRDAAAHCPKKTSNAQCSMDYLLCRIGIIPNHAMEISEFIGRTITLLHRVDSRIPQRINLKTLPMRNTGLFDGVYSYIKNKNRASACYLWGVSAAIDFQCGFCVKRIRYKTSSDFSLFGCRQIFENILQLLFLSAKCQH